jgi:hypothetical protein
MFRGNGGKRIMDGIIITAIICLTLIILSIIKNGGKNE